MERHRIRTHAATTRPLQVENKIGAQCFNSHRRSVEQLTWNKETKSLNECVTFTHITSQPLKNITSEEMAYSRVKPLTNGPQVQWICSLYICTFPTNHHRLWRRNEPGSFFSCFFFSRISDRKHEHLDGNGERRGSERYLMFLMMLNICSGLVLLESTPPAEFPAGWPSEMWSPEIFGN